MFASFSAWLDFGYEARAAEAWTHFTGKTKLFFFTNKYDIFYLVSYL